LARFIAGTLPCQSEDERKNADVVKTNDGPERTNDGLHGRGDAYA